MQEIRCIQQNTVLQTEIKKSKFIAFCFYVQNEQAVQKALDELKQKYSDATHICFAYICDAAGTKMRFSDDGEPQGTAGQPILETIKSAGLKMCLVAVVRYFGGIKLGAGGLLRAYKNAAAACLSASGTITKRLCGIFEVQIDYNDYEPLKRRLLAAGAQIIMTQYDQQISIQFATDDDSICPEAKKMGEDYFALQQAGG